MKIVMVSLTFLPKVGGLENVMSGLANEWYKKGHELTVFTDVPTNTSETEPYDIKRAFSTIDLFKKVAKADIFLEANISLKTCWVGLLNRKKWFITHQLHYSHGKDWKGKLKNYLTKFTHNISCSNYVANTLVGKSIVINNFFQPIFQRILSINKTKEIVFLGRLVSDKGAAVLLRAIHLLNNKNITVTIIGNGPEKVNLEKQIADLQLRNIHFAGIKKGQDLVTELNAHKILVVPSTWPEPYGIVALEGMACGCLVIASNNGGLPEAVNKFGILYNDNDPQQLAIAIEKALNNFDDYAQDEAELQRYLANKKVEIVAQQYLDYFNVTIATPRN